MKQRTTTLGRAWILLGLAIWALAVAVTLLDVRNHLEQGRRGLQAIVDTPADELRLEPLVADVEQASAELAAARRKSASPVLLPLRPLPVVGRHLAVVRTLSASAAGVAAAGSQLLHNVEAWQADPERSRTVLLSTLRQDLAAVERTLDSAAFGPEGNLIGPLADAQFEFRSRTDEAHDGVRTAQRIVAGLEAFVAESDYLLLGANNSEMRLGSGMVLSVGELQVRDGEVTVGDLEPSEDLFPAPTWSPSSPRALDPDVEARWGFLAPTNDYRKLTYTARFAEYSGPQALLMWEAQKGRAADGAILIDPFVIDAILDVVGPVEVEGLVFTSGMALDYLLVDQYAAFGADEAQTDERRDRLSIIATAVVARLSEGDFDAVELLSKMPGLVRGRHLLAYSTDPTQQAGWEELELAGELAGDETGVYLLNNGGSKLDPYLDVDVEVHVGAGPTPGTRTVRYAIEVTNTVQDGTILPAYAAGPWENIRLPEAGTYTGRLVVYAPGAARGLRFESGQRVEVYGADGQVWVLGTSTMLAPGEKQIIDISYEIDTSVRLLEIEPSARFPSVDWTFGDVRTDDSARFALDLGDG